MSVTQQRRVLADVDTWFCTRSSFGEVAGGLVEVHHLPYRHAEPLDRSQLRLVVGGLVSERNRSQGPFGLEGVRRLRPRRICAVEGRYGGLENTRPILNPCRVGARPSVGIVETGHLSVALGLRCGRWSKLGVAARHPRVLPSVLNSPQARRVVIAKPISLQSSGEFSGHI